MTHDNRPLITLVVPFRNAAAKVDPLLSCIDRIAVNHEVIFVNDQSTDAGPEKILAFCARKANRKMISGSFNGPGPARDLGIRMATGTWVWLVDADDLIDPEVIGACTDIWNGTPADILSFVTREDVREGGELTRYTAEAGQSKYQQSLRFGRIGSKLFRTQWLRTNRVFYERSGVATDNIFVANAVASSPVVRTYDEVIYTVVLTEDSITTTKFDWRRLSRIFVFARISEILAIEKEDETTRRQFFFDKVYVNVFRRSLYQVLSNKSKLDFISVAWPMFFLTCMIYRRLFRGRERFAVVSRLPMTRQDRAMMYLIASTPSVFHTSSLKCIEALSRLDRADSALRLLIPPFRPKALKS